jgi:ParB family chromosome partitioning protein
MSELKVRPLEDFDDMLNFEVEPLSAPKNTAPKKSGNTPAVSSGGESEMEFAKMKPFPNHPFQLYTGKRLDDMVESIKQFGILFPVILWHKGNNVYLILSGHNRVNSGKIAGLSKSPVIIKENLTEEEAMLIVTETNLRQRGFTELSHSERAISLKNHYEAIKCQGKRNDLIKEIDELMNPLDNKAQGTSSQVETKSRADEKVGQDYGLSHAKVARYIRLASLNPFLLAYVDTGNIPFLAAYDISFVENKELQTAITNIIKRDDCKVDMKMAALLRKYYENRSLTDDVIEQILSGEKTRKPKSDKPKPFSLKPAFIKKHFFKKEYTPAEIETIIDQALSDYFIKEKSA